MEIRRLRSTTKVVERLPRLLQKIVKTRSHFLADEAAVKLLHLVLADIQAHWQRRHHARKAAMTVLAMQLSEYFGTYV
jgi:putative transposase